jgi:Zn-dependent protease
MKDLTFVQELSLWLMPVLFAITLHEVAHGWVAKKLGDRTAEKMGRLSLNPLHHVDPVGTLLIPGVLLALQTGVIFGWAKPVPVDFGRLRKPRRDMVLVAVAGPVANLIMALFWVLIIRLAILVEAEFFTVPMALMGQRGIHINLLLMIINLLPIPPLDGGRIAVGLLPPRLGDKYAKIEPYGFFILLIFIFTPLLSIFLNPPLSLMQRLLYGAAGIN